MSETVGVSAAVLAGVLLGAVFFGGLWWTVRRALPSSQAPLWFFGSLLIRTAIVLGGFYLVSHGDWRRMVGCVAGFLLARTVVFRLTSPGRAIEGAS